MSANEKKASTYVNLEREPMIDLARISGHLSRIVYKILICLLPPLNVTA